MTIPGKTEVGFNLPEGRRPERADRYIYRHFTEASDPLLAVSAQQVHAVGYKGEGFVNDDAIEADGTMSANIDKARGPNVDYFVGFGTNGEGNSVARSTIRKVHIPFGQTIESLPAYQIAADSLYPEALEELRAIANPDRTIKEISAFAHSPEVSSAAGLEIIRNILQDSLGSHEKWMFTMVASRFEALVRSFGPKMMRQIGEPVPVTGTGVNEGVELVSAIVDTDTYLSDIHDSIVAEDDMQIRTGYMNGLKYLTQGLTSNEMGEAVATFVSSLKERQKIVAQPTQVRSLGFEALIGSLQKEVSVWQQPERFDLGSIADRREVQRRIEDGRITSTFQARNVLADDLFDLRYPELTKDATQRQAFIDFSDSQGIRFGPWFHMPWDGSLVQYPEMQDHQALRTMRNRGLDTLSEQAVFLRARLFSAGLSVGSETLDLALRGGVGGAVMLADFDTLSLSNLNRIRGSYQQLGMNKTDMAGIKISELDPYVEQVHLRSGVGPEQIEAITAFKPDIIFDEVDDLAAKALLRQIAAQLKVPLIMATDVDDKSIIDIERHDLGAVEPFNGRLNNADIEAMLAGDLSPKDRFKIVAKLTGLTNASFRLLASTRDPSLAGKLSQLGATASEGGALSTRVTRAILSGQKVPSGRHIESQSKTLKLRSQTSPAEALRILKSLRQN